MTPPTRDELRAWNAALNPGPIDVGDAQEQRYVRFGDGGPVDDLLATIELALDTTTQLLAGQAGSGRSTELLRLRHELREAGFQAVVVPIMNYLSDSSDVALPDFLLALLAGARDALVGPGEGPDITGRVRALLPPDLVLTDTWTAELRTSPRFVDDLRRALATAPDQLHRLVQETLRELLPPSGVEGCVLLVDGLALRATAATEAQRQRSVAALFVEHARRLRFATHHLVYAVPAELLLVAPGALPFDQLTRLTVPDPHRERDDLAVVLAHRVPVGAILPDRASLDAVVDASGGHLGDLLSIMRTIVHTILRRGLTLPVARDVVTSAIDDVARDLGLLTSEEVAVLRGIAGGAWSPSAEQFPTLSRLVNRHVALLRDGGFAVHPLVERALATIAR